MGTPDVQGGKASARAFIAPFREGRELLGPDIDAVQADADAELQDAFDADSSFAEVFGDEAGSDEP